MLLILLASMVLSAMLGAVHVPPRDVLSIIVNHILHFFGLQFDAAYTQQQNAVVWSIRLPRILLGMLVGSALAVSGAALQGMFRNPLADPALIGVSNGAALGAVLALGLSLTTLGRWTTPVFAFVGGVTFALLGYALARQNGRTEVVTLILAGIALNTFAGAGVALITFIADDSQLRAIIFWSMGSLGGASWRSVMVAAPFVIAGLIASFWWRRPLNLMTLGEREARHLGVQTERTRFSGDRLYRPDGWRHRGRCRCGRLRRAHRAACDPAHLGTESPSVVARLGAGRGDPGSPGRPDRAHHHLAAGATARGADRVYRRSLPSYIDAQDPPCRRRLEMTAILQVERVGIQASGRWLVRDVSFELERGEVLAILGPNGAGKSTLLAALAGDSVPAEGSIMFEGRSIFAFKPLELARRRAVLPQQTFVQFAFTAREIVEMGRAAIDDDLVDRAVVDRVLRETDVYDLQHRIFPTLSVGEQARVTLSRVLAQETPILLLDEPTAALDLSHQQLVMELACKLASEGAAVAVVLHDLNLASAYADRILMLREGRIAALGSPRDTLTESLLGDIFACRVSVIPHPQTGRPLVLPMSAAPVLAR